MSARSGQITVAAAGTAVAGPSTPLGRRFALKAHPDNTDTVWIGNDGENDVTSSNGFPLDPGEGVIVEVRRSLAEFYIDADANGGKVCWAVLDL